MKDTEALRLMIFLQQKSRLSVAQLWGQHPRNSQEKTIRIKRGRDGKKTISIIGFSTEQRRIREDEKRIFRRGESG